MGERAGCAQAAGPHLKIKKIAAALLNEALGSICPAERFSGTGFSPAGDGSQVCAAPGDGLPKKKKTTRPSKVSFGVANQTWEG